MKTLNLTTKILTALSLTMAMTACKSEPKAQSQAPTANATEETQTLGKVKYSTKPDGRDWKVITDDSQEQVRMTQFILANEEPENVSELFTVTEMTDVNITPSEYFSQFITELQKRYSDIKVESKIINQHTSSLLGEWWVDGKSPDNTQHEWVRIIKKGNNIAVLRYSTTHVDSLEDTRKVWESILNGASYQ